MLAEIEPVDLVFYLFSGLVIVLAINGLILARMSRQKGK